MKAKIKAKVRRVRERLPKWLAITSWIATNVFFNGIAPTGNCMDGWISQSVGIQGACSSHGGVSYAPQAIMSLGFLISFVVAWIVYYKVKKWNKPKVSVICL